MIKEIVKDEGILSQVSLPADEKDQEVINDLLDTLKAHESGCVGMAANMIGILKQIIAIHDEDNYLVMVNPIILKTSPRYYEAEEGCLCHRGVKKVKRYESIKVQYYNDKFKMKIKTFKGFSAQIIQHEIDHCKGILI